MKTFFGSIIGTLVGVLLLGLIFGNIWSVPLTASAAPAAQATEEPAADDVICVTTSDGDEICLALADWLVLLEKIQQVTGTATAADAPANPAADATAVDNDLTPATGGNWDRAQKCEWLKANFPQSTAGVQAYGVALVKAHGIDIPLSRVRPHIYHCTSNEAVFDGLIILGPNEGFSGAVKVTVPQYGAVDGYDPACGAVYSTTPVLINQLPNRCDSTWRVVSGTAQGLSLTVWGFNDGNSLDDGNVIPAAAAAAVEATAVPTATVEADTEIECVHPTDIAAELGARDVEWAAEKYGGRRVEVTTAVELPLGWEAETSGQKIGENDTDRLLLPGFWSLYPPRACRDQWGYEQ